ncbi:hypothetical protein J4558_17650 [Leptolyngbya sp. 15MV]|nr:hypothetical protein J4558_17650 [Leptolyngbya sp. 15MV]
MATDAKSARYAAMVQEAEAAVAAVKDPELRRVAFEKILATLLDEAPTRPKPSKKAKGADAPNVKEVRAAKPAARGPKAKVEELVQEGFFKKQQTIAAVKAELANRGYHIPVTSLSGPLQKLTQEKKLRRQKVTADGKGSKTTYAYSNWG